MLREPASDLDAARERIRAAYDPELFRASAHCFADLLATHLRSVQASSENVLNWNEPADNCDQAALALEKAATEGTQRTSSDEFAELVRQMLSRGQNLHDPRYVGHQVPASVPLAGLFDAVGSVTNQVMAIYEMGPWATAVENAVVAKLMSYLGWNTNSSAGIVTHGASLANLTALLVARNVALPESWEQGLADRNRPAPLLISQPDAHYCIARSAGILGLGTKQVVKAPLDGRRRIDPVALDRLLAERRSEGHPIIAVVACACATPIGAFDPLEAIADVCQRHAVWLHVDAAHGGAALLSERHRHLLAGLERADSLVWDAHKMLFVPALCAILLYKNKRHSYEAFRQDAPYLFDPSTPGLAEFDCGLRTVECTKRAAAFGLWGVWSMFGPQLFADLVDVTFALGREFHEQLRAAPDFEALHEPECNIVVFRHVPAALRNASPAEIGEFQLRLRRDMIRSGEFYLVPATFGGTAALRCTLINPLTTGAHLQRLLAALRTQGEKILSGAP